MTTSVAQVVRVRSAAGHPVTARRSADEQYAAARTRMDEQYALTLEDYADAGYESPVTDWEKNFWEAGYLRGSAVGAAWERARHVPVDVTDEILQRLREAIAAQAGGYYLTIESAQIILSAALGGGEHE